MILQLFVHTAIIVLQMHLPSVFVPMVLIVHQVQFAQQAIIVLQQQTQQQCAMLLIIVLQEQLL